MNKAAVNAVLHVSWADVEFPQGRDNPPPPPTPTPAPHHQCSH